MSKDKNKKLDLRETKFVEELFVDPKRDIKAAAIRAGYAATTADSFSGAWIGSDREHKRYKAHVVAAIEAKQAAMVERYEIVQDKVLQEHAVIAFSDISNHITVDELGCAQLKTFESMPPGSTRAIRKFKEKKKILALPDGNQLLESTTEVELWDKPGAIRDIGKHLNIYTEKVEHTADSALIAALLAGRQRSKKRNEDSGGEDAGE